MSSLLYVDTSALAKLVLHEDESDRFKDTLGQWDGLVSSALAAIELRRAVGRMLGAGPNLHAAAETVLASLTLIPIADNVAGPAGAVPPADLRTLDAIHLATILLVREEIGAVATYDTRLADAVTAQGIVVLSPR